MQACTGVGLLSSVGKHKDEGFDGQVSYGTRQTAASTAQQSRAERSRTEQKRRAVDVEEGGGRREAGGSQASAHQTRDDKDAVDAAASQHLHCTAWAAAAKPSIAPSSQ